MEEDDGLVLLPPELSNLVVVISALLFIIWFIINCKRITSLMELRLAIDTRRWIWVEGLSSVATQASRLSTRHLRQLLLDKRPSPGIPIQKEMIPIQIVSASIPPGEPTLQVKYLSSSNDFLHFGGGGRGFVIECFWCVIPEALNSLDVLLSSSLSTHVKKHETKVRSRVATAAGGKGKQQYFTAEEALVAESNMVVDEDVLDLKQILNPSQYLLYRGPYSNAELENGSVSLSSSSSSSVEKEQDEIDHPLKEQQRTTTTTKEKSIFIPIPGFLSLNPISVNFSSTKETEKDNGNDDNSNVTDICEVSPLIPLLLCFREEKNPKKKYLFALQFKREKQQEAGENPIDLDSERYGIPRSRLSLYRQIQLGSSVLGVKLNAENASSKNASINESAKFAINGTVSKFLVIDPPFAFELFEMYGLDQDSECLVCMSEPKSIALLPCRHLCVCDDCFKHIEKCPVCRSPYSSYLKGYPAKTLVT